MVNEGGRRTDHPTPVILDTDIFSDVDDVGALAVLHMLADLGEAELLATVANTDSRWAATCLSAVNAACGRPRIPVGGRHPVTDAVFPRDYARHLTLTAPGHLTDGAEAAPALEVYREILAARSAADVTIVSVGALTTLAELLQSGSDEHSPLGGPELISHSVRELVIMGGTYPSGTADDFNFTLDPTASATVLSRWPGPVTFVGFELGFHIGTGSPFRQDPTFDGPVADAYRRYLHESPDRPSWDLIAAYAAVRGEDGLFRYHPDTGVSTFRDGVHRWQPGAGRHRYLIQDASPDRITAQLDRLLTGSAGARRKDLTPS